MAEFLAAALQAEEAILTICATPDADHSDLLLGFEASVWHCLAEAAARTRTSPLILRAIERCSSRIEVPEPSFTILREQTRLHAIGTLQLGQDLNFILDLLQSENLSPIILKGLTLSFRDYPDPSLRPLRDLDLLLTGQDALKAQQLLMSHSDFEQLNGAGLYGLEYGHQLPEIRRRSSRNIFELHHRLDARGWAQEPVLVRSMFENAERTSLLGRKVRVPRAEDNFLHLIEHATLHHLFENGPLILADLYYLTCGQELDWVRVKERVHKLGLTNSLALIGTIAREHGANWVTEDMIDGVVILPEHLTIAKAALFADSDQAARQKMLQRLAERSHGKMTWGAAFLRAFMPDPTQLSLYSGQPPDSMLRWMGYPKWLVEKAKLFGDAKASRLDVEAAKMRHSLAEWLVEG